MIWRIYRLPGSRETWLVDSGPETVQYPVRGIEIKARAISRDDPGQVPRAWLEVSGTDMYVLNEIAIFPGAV